MRRTDTTPRSIPSTGTSSGRCWRGRSAASHSCSARSDGVVLLELHRPAADQLRRRDRLRLRSGSRNVAHLAVWKSRSLLLRNVVLRSVREHVPGRLRRGAGGDGPDRRMALPRLLPSSAEEALMFILPTTVSRRRRRNPLSSGRRFDDLPGFTARSRPVGAPARNTQVASSATATADQPLHRPASDFQHLLCHVRWRR